MNLRRGWLLVAAAAALLPLAAFIGWPVSPPAGPADPVPATPVSTAAAFAPSLQGTRPDGAVRVAPDDSVVVDEQLIGLFDYYLSTVGEKSPDQVRAQIERELDRTLRPPAAAAAKRVLARYFAYKQALGALEARQGLAGMDAASLQRRLAALATLRARFFSRQEIAAVFGREDAANQEALARLRIREDVTLTPQQKQERLAALEASLSPAERAAREAPLKIGRMQEEVERMRAAGADDDAIFRLRAEAFGADAAGRLAEVDREEAAWKQRIAAYLAQRRGLQDEAAVAALRSRMFSEEEQRRLAVYESGQL
ncbi:lipase secretion chaperone [Massilia norwichensis]|uniref:Lipase helper protein n=1 Tax=Massilia norwichensis TaxID=1442366 RepID=A0ABT2A3Y3_9BURK|nr:lipase chaperone [Massilia norwichensis]